MAPSPGGGGSSFVNTETSREKKPWQINCTCQYLRTWKFMSLADGRNREWFFYRSFAALLLGYKFWFFVSTRLESGTDSAVIGIELILHVLGKLRVAMCFFLFQCFLCSTEFNSFLKWLIQKIKKSIINSLRHILSVHHCKKDKWPNVIHVEMLSHIKNFRPSFYSCLGGRLRDSLIMHDEIFQTSLYTILGAVY